MLKKIYLHVGYTYMYTTMWFTVDIHHILKHTAKKLYCDLNIVIWDVLGCLWHCLPLIVR